VSASLSATIRQGAAGGGGARSGAGAQSPLVTWAEVQVRPFGARDVDEWIRYLYYAPRDSSFLQQLDMTKFPLEGDYRSQLQNAMSNFLRFPWLIVEVKGQVVGTHLLSEFADDGTANFHGHIWRPELRGKGIGIISWFKACTYFFETLRPLRTIYFKFPSGDSALKRFAGKLPLSRVGEEPLQSQYFRDGQMGSVYKIERTEFENLNRQDSDLDMDED